MGAEAACDFCKRPILKGDSVGYIVLSQPKGTWRSKDFVRISCYTCNSNFKEYLINFEANAPRRSGLPPEDLSDD